MKPRTVVCRLQLPCCAAQLRTVATAKGVRLSKKRPLQLLEALDGVAQRLAIQQPSDWHSVSSADLVDLGFPRLSRTEFLELLEKKYPDQRWDRLEMLKGKFAQQKRMERAVKSLFPGVEMISNAKKEAGVINPESGLPLELDLYLPSLNLAFEYQEKHHFTSSEYTYQPVAHFKERDKAKRDLVAEKGITLITVPCWWDRELNSLAATIKKARPDLLTHIPLEGSPIQEDIPKGFLEKDSHQVEDVGEPTNACFFTLSTVDPVKWWMFEKYDGVRGFWNPLKKAFFSRRGNRFTFPQEIIDAMPSDLFLDGELWFGRENFHEAMKIAQRVPEAQIDWSKFKYMVYDSPKTPDRYELRYQQLVDRFSEQPCKYIEVAPREACKSISHLEVFLQDIIDKGGEGIILRDPYSLLQPGRSAGYLKHKKFRDAEARVINSVAPHRWECEMPNGVRFVAAGATTEFAKRCSPEPGAIVSFKHHGFLVGSQKPKFPTLYRLRTDISWEDVVQNWKDSINRTTVAPLRKPVSRLRRKGYWNEQENQRQFFTDIAIEKGLDPLQAESWEKITFNDVLKKRGSGLVSRYGSLLRAVESAFPELKGKLKGSDKKPTGYWKQAENRRRFFIGLAGKLGFDPLDANAWQRVTSVQINKEKGGAGLLTHFQSPHHAIAATFPELQVTFKDKNSSALQTKDPQRWLW